MITVINDKIVNFYGFRMIETTNEGIRIYYNDNSYLDIETNEDKDLLMNRLELLLKQM